jgi:excisionase family DNA binding protein
LKLYVFEKYPKSFKKLVFKLPHVDFKAYQNSEQAEFPSEAQMIISAYSPYLTIKDASKCLHRSYETIYALVRSRELKAARTGEKGSYLIPASEIVSYMKKWRY